MRCWQAVPRVDNQAIVLAARAQATATTEANAQQEILSVKNLSVRFPVRSGVLRRVTDHVIAVDDVSFTLMRGQTLALVGESGSGKTTIAKAVLRLLDNQTGAIAFQHQRVDTLRGKALRRFRRQVQVILQDPFSSMNPKLTIGEIVCEGMRAQNLYAGATTIQHRTLDLLHKVGLEPDILHRYPPRNSLVVKDSVCALRERWQSSRSC